MTGYRQQPNTPSKATLFFGDNGIHEFWESKSGNVIILRNHSSPCWTVGRKDGVFTDIERQSRAKKGEHCILSHNDIKKVLELLRKQYGILATLDKNKHWIQVKGRKKMSLVPTKEEEK